MTSSADTPNLVESTGFAGHRVRLPGMRAVLQRVSQARVEVDGEIVGAIDGGYLVLLGVEEGDSKEQAAWLVRKIADLRLFADDAGKFDRSLRDVGGSLLVVSQFTLMGDASKGNRPSFIKAARPEVAEPLYECFCSLALESGIHVERGRFGAMMQVHLVNDGPVTLILDR